MADRIKNYQQEADQITTLKAIRTDLGVTPSSYTPDATVVTKDRVVTFAQAEEELVVLSDIEKGVKQQVTEVDIAQKDIANIKALLQGHLYDYQTDSTSAYTKSVPSGAMPYAGLEKVGGKTLIMNQLVNSGTTSVATISGHKYYTLIDGTASIVTADGTAITIVDDTADMVFDLTLMFGSGNEPSTTADFSAIFGATHYSYNAGTLLSAGVTEVESVGKNLFNPTGATLINLTYTNGVFVNTAVDSKTICTFTVQYFNNGTYISNAIAQQVWDSTGVKTFTFTATTSCNQINFGHSGSKLNVFCTCAMNIVAGKTYTISLDLLSYNPSVIGGLQFDKFQIEESATATAYSPYTKIDYPIPAEIQALEGYGWSAGTAYNYVDFERKVFVQNVGAVDLGTLNWVYDGNYFSVVTPSNAKSSISSGIPAVCGRYESYFGRPDAFPTSDKSIICNSTYMFGGVIFVKDSAYSDATTFKSAMSGVYLYYELDTPVETDISAYLTDDNLIQVEAGGTLTFPNSNGDDYRLPVPSEETYMIDLQEAINNG